MYKYRTVEKKVRNSISALSDSCYNQYLPNKADQIHKRKGRGKILQSSGTSIVCVQEACSFKLGNVRRVPTDCDDVMVYKHTMMMMMMMCNDLMCT